MADMTGLHYGKQREKQAKIMQHEIETTQMS